MKKLILLIIFSLGMLLSFNKYDYIHSSASWYGDKHHGRYTASGKVFNKNMLTAAHKTLKFGTKLEVVNINNDKNVIVEVTDRGPFVKGRDLDLSEGAFKQIANLKSGVIKIKYKIVN